MMDHAEAAYLYKKVTYRLMPLLFAAYVVAYVDRISIGLAKLRMMDDLGLSERVYGLGAGIFFLGFILFEVPSNLFLARTGARVWLSRIMITWGLVAMATMFVASARDFYLARFMLGLAEAGFIPGVTYYLSHWYPPNRRGKAFAILLLGAPVGGILTGPLSGWILTTFDSAFGLYGWQWMFLIEGAPAIILGVCILWLMKDHPRDVRWLSDRQAARIETEIDATKEGPRSTDTPDRIPPLSYWCLTFVMFSISISIYAGVFWLPSFIQKSGIHDLQTIDWLSMTPYCAAALAMLCLGYSSDRFKDRAWHIGLSCALSAAGFTISCLPFLSAPWHLAGLIVSTAAAIGVTPVIWAYASALLNKSNRAVCLALLNVIGSIGGFTGPTLIGLTKASPRDDVMSVVLVGGLILTAGIFLVLSGRKSGRIEIPV